MDKEKKEVTIQGEIWLDRDRSTFRDTTFECWKPVGFGYITSQLNKILYDFQGKEVEITIKEL
jgi:hypothetical protein